MKAGRVTLLVGPMMLCGALTGLLACGDDDPGTKLDTGSITPDSSVQRDFSQVVPDVWFPDAAELPDTTVTWDTGVTPDTAPTADTGTQPADSANPVDAGAPADTAPPADLAGPATCSPQAGTILLQEVATGAPDYVVIGNVGSTNVDISGYRLDMWGINSAAPVTFTFSSGTSVPATGSVYVFEYATGGTGDINTGSNIPFYNDLMANAVLLWDASDKLVDYVAIGTSVRAAPSNVVTTAVAWPANFDSTTQSLHQKTDSASCPNFPASDWSADALSK